MQVMQMRGAMSTLTVKQVDVSGDTRSNTKDVGEAMDQSAGISSRGTEVAIALDLVSDFKDIKEWLLNRIGEKVSYRAS